MTKIFPTYIQITAWIPHRIYESSNESNANNIRTYPDDILLKTKRMKSIKKPLKQRVSTVFLVEHMGLEPMTPTLPVWCASQLR